MGRFKVEQRRITLQGREFHFVSYEGQPANAARQQAATAPTWYLMSDGKRWLVMPHEPGQEPDELDGLLISWLETHVFS